MYAQKFSSLFATPNAIDNWKNVWGEGLADLTAEQLAKGLRECLKYDWPPSLPEFRKLCVDCDAEKLYWAAMYEIGKPRSERLWGKLAFWAAQRFGEFDLKHSSWDTAKTRWSAIIDDMHDQPLPEVPEYREALPSPGKIHNAETARKNIEKIKSIIRVKNAA